MKTTAPAADAAPRFAKTMFAAGVACVVAGGLVAAFTGPLGLAKGSWAAAYLVLVCGTASCAIGAAQDRFIRRPMTASSAWAQAGAWAAGNAAVIAGTLTRLPVVVDVGAALLVAALGIALARTRGAAPGPATRAYRLVLVVLLASIPVGMVLAHLRN
ncbi:MAG TPA: hypothetical protein VKZ65_14945 [Glycomyces sp.]|nr:hypothetical protein [Glycomyces sp.]